MMGLMRGLAISRRGIIEHYLLKVDDKEQTRDTLFFQTFDHGNIFLKKNQVLKFALGQTVLVQERRLDPLLTLPAFAACPNPGHRRSKMVRSLNLSLSQWSYEPSRPPPKDFK